MTVTCYLLYKKFIFTEADPAYPPDTYVSELLYHQAFDAVIRGRLPVSEVMASELAAITMQLAYGDFTDRPYYLYVLYCHTTCSQSYCTLTWSSCSDRLKPHVPTHWLPRASPAEWLARIVPIYQRLKGLSVRTLL